jgi:3-oxo-5alpha-steroid 4-dehydrogenase
MLAQHVPRALRCSLRVAGDGDDGSGIRLGMAAGAATRNLDKASISLIVTEPWGLKRGVLVNALGQRCIQEDRYMGHLGEQALFHQDGKVWLIVDDEIYEPLNFGGDITATGESFEELELELGMPAGSLVPTLETYNRYAAKGEDPLFHKLEEYLKPLDKPPYGAIECSTDSVRYAAFTLGGLVTDVDGRVLDPEHQPIRNLYAAGRTTSGLSVGSYSSGLSLGDSTFFGRRAGLAAATTRTAD